MKTLQYGGIIWLIIFMLSACSHKPINYLDESLNLSSKQIIEYYINALNEKNFDKVSTVLSEEMNTITFNYNSIKSINILSCEPIEVYKLSDNIKNLREVNVYKVITHEVLQNNNIKLKTVEQTYIYYVGREKENSPWLIYDMLINND